METQFSLQPRSQGPLSTSVFSLNLNNNHECHVTSVTSWHKCHAKSRCHSTIITRCVAVNLVIQQNKKKCSQVSQTINHLYSLVLTIPFQSSQILPGWARWRIFPIKKNYRETTPKISTEISFCERGLTSFKPLALVFLKCKQRYPPDGSLASRYW